MAWQPFRNLGLKIVALGLGTLLWFTVSGQQAERIVPGVAVVYRNKPASLELTEQTSYVDIQVRGLDNQLRTVQARDFEARVDLSGVQPGAQRLSLRTDHISAPFGIEVTQVSPGSVMVVLEPGRSASMPVKPYIEGAPAAGYVVSEIAVDPASVVVTGPSRRIAATSAATTDRISIEGASSSIAQTVGIGVSDPALRLKEARTARVVVKIEPAGERVFAASRVVLRNLEPGLRGHAEPAVVSIVMRGAQSLLARLEAGALVPYVDVTGLGRGRHEVPVLVDPSGTLTVASIRPAQVTVVVQ